MLPTLKILLPLVVSVASISLLYTGYQVRTERRNLDRDLSRRASILAETLGENLEPQIGRESDRNLQRYIERFVQHEHLKGVAVYDASGNAIAITAGISQTLSERPAAALHAAEGKGTKGET